jgi:rubrerythrin
MCWKQEWAAAINNLTNAINCIKKGWLLDAIRSLDAAITHIYRAQVKLEKRLQRNITTVQRLSNNPKYNYPRMIEPAQKLITHNTNGVNECKQIITNVELMKRGLHQDTTLRCFITILEKTQDQLYRMIHSYGIKHVENPQRVYKLMGAYASSAHAATVEIPKDYGQPNIAIQATSTIRRTAGIGGQEATCEKCGKTRITRVDNPVKCPICGHVPGAKIRVEAA